MCGGSQNAKRIIDTICLLFPYTRLLPHLSFKDDRDWAWWTALFLSRIAIYYMKQSPAELLITVEHLIDSLDGLVTWVIYLPNLKTQTVNRGQQPLSESNELEELSNFTSLSALSLPVVSDVTGYIVVKYYLTTSSTLEKVALTLIGEPGDGCSRELVELRWLPTVLTVCTPERGWRTKNELLVSPLDLSSWHSQGRLATHLGFLFN